MDSLTQFMLGASVGLVISPVKTRKIALISGTLATLPDLDILLSHGDALRDMINHRSFSHSFVVLSLLSLPLAFGLKRFFADLTLSTQRWFWLCFWVLNTHTWLDALTIFGTQIFWPSAVASVSIASMFIFDVFYIAPLLATFGILMYKKQLPVWRWFSANTWALGLSSMYLVLMLLLQQHAFSHTPPPSNTKIINSFTMPTPSNGVIWRTVYIDEQNSYERFYNLITQNHSPWLRIAHRKNDELPKDPALEALIAKYGHFSHGFYRLQTLGNDLIIHDIRMGTTDMPIFAFKIGEKQAGVYRAVTPIEVPLAYFSFVKMFGNFASIFDVNTAS